MPACVSPRFPIPTYYGDEICYVDGMGYAADVTKDVITYRLQKAGFGDGTRIALERGIPAQAQRRQLSRTDLEAPAMPPPSRILDLGCSSGSSQSACGVWVTMSSAST